MEKEKSMQEIMNSHSELQKELDNSTFKTCVDVPGERVIIFVTDKHLLVCDKLERKNQLLVPFREFIKRWESYKETNDGGTEEEKTAVD